LVQTIGGVQNVGIQADSEVKKTHAKLSCDLSSVTIATRIGFHFQINFATSDFLSNATVCSVCTSHWFRLQHLQTEKDYHSSYTHFSFFLSAEENTQAPRQGKTLIRLSFA